MTQNLGSTSNPLSMTGEQWVLEERTDDPLSPDPGECWIRTDLNAGDKIATLKFGDGSEVPIFPTGTSEPGVFEVRRVQTGGQTGYLPVAEPDESRFPQFRLQHNNTVYGLHNAPSVIPDSGGTHQWNTDEGDGTTLADSISNLDGAINGATWVSGVGTGNAYLDYDKTADYVDLGSASRTAFKSFTSELEGTFGFWINQTDHSSLAAIVGSTNNSGSVGVHLATRQDASGGLRWGCVDGSGSRPWEIVDAGSIPTGEWVFVAGTADGSTAKAWLAEGPSYDVTELGSETVSGGTSADWEFNANFGRMPDDGWFWGGGIDLGFSDSVGWSETELQSFVDDSKGLYE